MGCLFLCPSDRFIVVVYLSTRDIDPGSHEGCSVI